MTYRIVSEDHPHNMHVRKHPQGAARAPDQLIRADIARVLGGGRAAQIDGSVVNQVRLPAVTAAGAHVTWA